METLLFEQSSVEAELAGMLGAPLTKPLRFDLQFSPSRSSPFSRALALLHSELNDPTELTTVPAMSSQLGRVMMAGLLVSQTHNYTQELSRPRAVPGSKPIRNALGLIESQPTEIETVADIAASVGLGVRALDKGTDGPRPTGCGQARDLPVRAAGRWCREPRGPGGRPVSTTAEPSGAPSVTRTKTMELTATGPERYRLYARLNDSSLHGDYGADDSESPSCSYVIHDFVVGARLEDPQLVVAELDVQARTHPYRQCPAVLGSCQALVGKSRASRWRATVLETLGATAGCTHVTTLLLGARRSAYHGFLPPDECPASIFRGHPLRWPLHRRGARRRPGIVDACHALSSTGPLIDEARKVAGRHPPTDRIVDAVDSDGI
jgi:Protein of unknown function (DUF2889)